MTALTAAPDSRLGRLGRGTRLIELLGRVELMPVEILHPGQVEPRALGLRLRGIGLRLGLLDGLLAASTPDWASARSAAVVGACEVEIRGRGPLVGLGRREIRAGLGERRLEIAGVDLDHELAGRHLLIVGDVQRHHPAADACGAIATTSPSTNASSVETWPRVSHQYPAPPAATQQAAGDRQPDPQMAVTYRRHWLRSQGCRRHRGRRRRAGER